MRTIYLDCGLSLIHIFAILSIDGSFPFCKQFCFHYNGKAGRIQALIHCNEEWTMDGKCIII